MNLRTENSGTWISVESRLPDDSMKGRTILTYVRHRFGGMTLGMVRWFGPEKTKRWQDVTHWMPIPDLSEGEEGDGRTVGRETRLMDKKKPLKDWTLNELKNHCKANIGKCSFDVVCPFKMICFNIEKDKYRLVEAHYPLNWDLDNTKPASPEHPCRWTKNDIEDAKAIKRLYPNTVKVERYKDADEIIKFICGSYYYVGHSGLLSGLAPGERVDLQEILDAEEDLNEK